LLPLTIAVLGVTLAAGWLLLGLVDLPDRMQQLDHEVDTVPVADVYGANEVGQSFRARWDGLSRVDVFLEAPAGPSQGIYRLRSPSDNEDVFVGEFTCPMAKRWCSLVFSPVEESEERAFAILLEAPQMGASEAIILSAWPKDIYPRGDLLLNGESVPLDLVFTPYYRLHSWVERLQWLSSRWQELLRTLDGPATSPEVAKGGIRKVLLVSLNLALFSLLGAVVITPTSQPHRVLVRWLELAVLGGELLVLALGVSVAHGERWMPPYPPRRVSSQEVSKGEIVVSDLLLELPTGELICETDPRLVGVRWFEINGQRLPVLWAHAFSRLQFRTEVPTGGKLKFGVAISPEVWDKDSDGVEFVITVTTAESIDQVYWRAIDPAHNPDDRRWFQEQVDLNRYAGREVLITLNTYPRENNNWDWAGWVHPVIVTGNAP